MTYMAMPIFNYAHPKTTKVTFSFPEFITTGKKITQLFILDVKQILYHYQHSKHQRNS